MIDDDEDVESIYRMSREGYVKEIYNLQDRLQDAKRFFQEILGQIYNADSINMSLLEWRIEELAGYLQVKCPDGDLKITINK